VSDTHFKKHGIFICSACGKPIEENRVNLVHKMRNVEKWYFHSTPEECASADKLKKDWRRIVRREAIETHNGTEAGLQDSDGYSWDTDDSMSMWFGDMEPQDHLR
jgi:hypothetical protein